MTAMKPGIIPAAPVRSVSSGRGRAEAAGEAAETEPAPTSTAKSARTFPARPELRRGGLLPEGRVMVEEPELPGQAEGVRSKLTQALQKCFGWAWQRRNLRAIVDGSADKCSC